MRISDWSSDVCSSDLGGVARLGILCGHEDNRRSAIVDAAGVGGRYRAVLLEGRPQPRHRVQRRAGPDIFVIGDHGVALAALARHRDDLVPEPARAARRLSLVLARDGEAVLLLAGYRVTLGQIFGRDAPM